MIEQRSLQERVRLTRWFESQRALMNQIPSFEEEVFCLYCNGFTNHIELGFEEPEEQPLLMFCDRCEHAQVNTTMPLRDKCRQMRLWAKWARETGGPGPAEVWLFLLPGEPAGVE